VIIGGDFTELIEDGGVNGMKLAVVVVMSTGKLCSSDLAIAVGK
jgi:hypothetical protein